MMFQQDDQGFIIYADSLLNDLILTDYSSKPKEYTGKLDFNQSRFNEIAWLKGLTPNVTIKTSGDAFTALAPLELPAFPSDFSPLALTLENVSLELSNIKEKDEYFSQAKLVMDAVFGNKDGIDLGNIQAKLKYNLLQGSYYTTFAAEFADSSGKYGISISDCFTLLPAMLGLDINFSTYLLSNLKFTNKIKLYDMELKFMGDIWNKACAGMSDAKPQLESFSVKIGFAGDVFSGGLKYISIENPTLKLLFSRDQKDKKKFKTYSELYGSLVIGEAKSPVIRLDTIASFPNFSIDAMSDEEVSLNEIAKYYLGSDLPEVMRDAKVQTVSVVAAPKEKEFCASLQLKDMIKIKLNSKAILCLDSTSFDMAYRQASLTADIGASLSIRKGNELIQEESSSMRGLGSYIPRISEQEKSLITLVMNASFSKGSASFEAFFVNYYSNVYGYDDNISISELYEALAEKSYPSDFPDIFITQARLAFTLTSNNSIDNFEFALGVEVKGWEVLGEQIDVDAAIVINKPDMSLRGVVTLDFLAVDVLLEYKASSMNLQCILTFDDFLIALSYETTATGRVIKGRIAKKGYTLGHAISYLIKLLNPEACVVNADEWKFLNKIELNGVELRYFSDTQTLQILMDMKTNLPFLKLEKAGLSMTREGVSFLIVGEFLGDQYSPEKPLTWDTSTAPPATTSGLLSVEYLAFANRVRINTRQLDVRKNIQLIQNEIGKDNIPKNLSNQAGFLFGLTCKIMDTVDLNLVYNDLNSLCGARFELYGDKAAQLAGLSAEIMYARIRDNIGVFSCKIVPPHSLRNLNVGGIGIGIGNIAVAIYTNGDFSIDLGFPHNRNFGVSFSLRYGIFYGSGGFYLSKNTLGNSTCVPYSNKGYFSPVISCGIGLRMGLSKSFDVFILSAGVSLSMSGIFQGVYATFLKHSGDGSSEYFKVTAYVEATGSLNGYVDFFIIGAGVHLYIHVNVLLCLEAKKSTHLNLNLYLEARASIKILWWWIHFGFSFHLRLDFELGSNQPAPWNKVVARQKLLFLSAAEKTTISVKVAPIWTATSMAGNDATSYGVTLVAAMVEEDFDIVVKKIEEVARHNQRIDDLHGMELLSTEKLFNQIDEVLQFLNTYFILELDFDDAQHSLEKYVLMPMPYPLTCIFETANASGTIIEKQECNLETAQLINADYFQRLFAYYQQINDKDNDNLLSYDNSDKYSMSEFIFTEFFDIIFRAIKTEKVNSEFSGRKFLIENLEPQQFGNIAGLTQRFLFGGKRVFKEKSTELEGMFHASEQQFSFEEKTNAEKITFTINLNDNSPGWIRLPASQKSLSLTLGKDEFMPTLPPFFKPEFAANYPKLGSFFSETDTTGLRLEEHANFDERLDVFSLGTRIKDGCVCTLPDHDCGFAIGIPLTTVPTQEAESVFIIEAGTEIENLRDFLANLNESEDFTAEMFIADTATEGAYLSCSSTPVIVKNRLTDKLVPRARATNDELVYASLKDNAAGFFSLLVQSYDYDGEYHIIFSEPPVLGKDAEQKLIMLITMPKDKNIYKRYFNAFWQPKEKGLPKLNWAEKQMQPALKQGRVRIEAITATDALLTETSSFSLALQLFNANGKAISGECIPVFAKNNESDLESYEFTIPAYRFIDNNSVYAGIASKETVSCEFFWVDILGNKLSTNTKLPLRLGYSDLLPTLVEYSGLEVSFLLDENNVNLMCEFIAENVDYTELEYAIHQLAQPDVTVEVASPFVKGGTVLLNKSDLLTFLEKCILDKADSTINIELPITFEDVPSLKEASMYLTVHRNKDLCVPNAPESVYKAQAEINYRELANPVIDRDKTQALCKPMLYEGSNLRILKEKERYYALHENKKELINISQGSSWACVTLPYYSGWLEIDDDKKIMANHVNFELIWQHFMDDVSLLLSPHYLHVYNEDKKSDIINRLVSIKKKAINAISHLIAPLDDQTTIKEAAKASLSSYLEELLLADFDLPRLDLVLMQHKYNTEKIVLHDNADSNAGTAINYHGTSSPVSSYRTCIATATKDGYMNTALEWDNIKNLSKISFHVDFVELATQNGTRWLGTGQSEKWNITMPDLPGIEPIRRDAPYSPILLSQQHKEDDSACIYVFQCSPSIKDELCFNFVKQANRKKVTANANQVFGSMYTYNEKREELLKNEDFDNLVTQMEKYVAALQLYDPSSVITNKPIEHVLTFQGENGTLTAIELNAPIEGLDIFYRYGFVPEEPMTKEEGGNKYFFNALKQPSASEPITFRFYTTTCDYHGLELCLRRTREGLNKQFSHQSSFVSSAL